MSDALVPCVTERGEHSDPCTCGALSMPDLRVSRGGIQFPPALAAGLAIEAVVAHTGRRSFSGDDDEQFYFVWRGKMWKAAGV